jgi:hypothetical protein
MPSHFLKEFKVECPICMSSSRKRKKLPGPSTVKEERAQVKKWEVVYVDTSGKIQVKSARDYLYYSVFVDRKDDQKIAIGHEYLPLLRPVLVLYNRRFPMTH